jgi:glycerophosphoryl diester phosphodiesterase
MSTVIDLPRIIAHRGAKANAPENTIAAFRRAHEEGARWVEFDVKLSADGHPVVIHDHTLERTTNGRGEVRAKTLAELQALDAGSWFGKSFAGERVPSLAETLDFLAAHRMGFNLEIKPCAGRERETAEVALKLVKARWPAGLPTPIISSFKLDSLETARNVAPEMPRGYLTEKLPPDWRATAERLGCAAIHPGMRHLTRDQAREIKAAGYALLTWTVNDAGRGRDLLAWGADSLITDAPGDIVAGLAL